MAKSKEEKNHVQGPQYAIVKAKFDLEAAKKNYQALLQNLAGTTVTRDNVNEDLTADAREVLKQLEDTKESETRAPLQLHRDILHIHNSLADPIKEHVNRINGEKKIIASEISAENAKQLAEQNRINKAKSAVIECANKVSNLIAIAKTDADIVEIEKMIGFEGRRTTLYQEFTDDLKERLEALRPDIKTQKENIRRLQQIEEDEKSALESGDIYSATKLREEKEELTTVIQQTSIAIGEKAFEQASDIDIVAPEIVDTAPKGRTNWKWRVDDIKLLQKKMPHLVKLVPDEDAINQLLVTKRLEGSLKDKMEEKFFGITFYNDKSYTR